MTNVEDQIELLRFALRKAMGHLAALENVYKKEREIEENERKK